MSDGGRPTCPKCGNVKTILEVEDRDSAPLYYSMQGQPVYKKKWKCGTCGEMWEK